MSVCLDASSVLASSVGTTTTTVTEALAPPFSSSCTSGSSNSQAEDVVASTPLKNVAKLIVTNHQATGSNTPVKVNPPLITVLNPSGPITVVKSICVNSTPSGTPQFTVVNSTPLTVTNSTTGKSPTITLLNAPVTMVKSIVSGSQNVENCKNDVISTSLISANGTAAASAVVDNKPTVHNVYVKSSGSSDLGMTHEIPQAQKLLTCNTFPQVTSVLSNVIPTATVTKTANGQKHTTIPNNKVKILSGTYVMPGGGNAGPSCSNNFVLNKVSTQQRCIQRQKLVSNGATPKYLNRPNNSGIVKGGSVPHVKSMIDKAQRVIYPTHKGQIKTLPPVNNFSSKSSGIKTISPQVSKTVPGHIQRTSSGLRTIPPQKPQKMPSKPNYIGKHAIQANKVKNSGAQVTGKTKTFKSPNSYNSNQNRLPASQSNHQVTFNQALTAEILETLRHNNETSSSICASTNNYDFVPKAGFESSYVSYTDTKRGNSEVTSSLEEKMQQQQSGLDTLSLICQAVLLDHNYNATLPSESPTRSATSSNVSPQMNANLYSPSGGCRSNLLSTNTVTNLSNNSHLPINSHSVVQDDDAASDISCSSERKHDTEGEETDTAPEAEAVANDDQFDHYGDYVTRCICDFTHDDGYMIECDNCKVWQHVRCVVRTKQVPDEYLCEVCDPTKPIDRQKARFLQQQWMRDGQFAEAKLRKEAKLKEQFKLKEILSDSDSSEVENTGGNNKLIQKGRNNSLICRKSEQVPRQNAPRQKRDTSKETANRKLFKRKERKMTKRKPKSQSKVHSDDEQQDPWSSSQLPQLRQWIENYEEAVTNHYSPELRARISNIKINGAHSDLATQMDPAVHKCRVHTQPLTGIKYLVSAANLSPNTPVVELRGKYMLSTQHRNSGGSLTTRQHAQRPGPFLFFYRLHKDNTEVCVDTRTYGNNARFIRRSCKPNAELRHCIEKGVLHLYIVTIASVEKNLELTIKHESHDLAVIGTTYIACACGKPDECTVNRGSVKKNGDTTENHRKKRGRRTTSQSETTELPLKLCNPSPPALIQTEKKEIIEVETKEEIETKVKIESDKIETVEQEPVMPYSIKTEVKEENEEVEQCTAKPVSSRRSSAHYKSESEDKKDVPVKEDKKNKKLSREERKIEAIMKAFERMERQQQRKQEHQAKQAHRRESEPTPNNKDENEVKVKRRRRKGRARTVSTTSQQSRRNRLNSAESSYATSGDENLLSPNDSVQQIQLPVHENRVEQNTSDKAVGLLLALANPPDNNIGDNKSPARDIDSNSNSAHSSPETPLSSACLLVAAAVEPLEPGFKFPKTKKGLMNEWLNKSPDLVQAASSISPSSLTPHVVPVTSDYDSNNGNFFTPAKSLVALAQAATFCGDNSSRGNAKKRWLRQAISEDQNDSPCSRPESPPAEMVAPPKKRRLPRESLSTDISPPSTPTAVTAPVNLQASEDFKPTQEGCVEIIHHCGNTDCDSPPQTLESEAVLKERAAEMQQEFGTCISLADMKEPPPNTDLNNLGCIMDPRLSTHDRPLFTTSEHLVGTVEKTLSILGFEDRKSEAATPTKRKLSITEYRQRKKLNNNDKLQEETVTEENNSSESMKLLRSRSDSTSSTASFISTDDEVPPPPPTETTDKALSAFNSEPTELERQRENVSIRLKKAFGLTLDEESRKPVINVESLLSCDKTASVKPSVSLSSPTFPIPGSCESVSTTLLSSSSSHDQHTIQKPSVQSKESNVEEKSEEANPVLYYTPDEEETVVTELDNDVSKNTYENVESTNYVPPFNNPVYPNSNFATYGSVIDDDVRYEGRNPSPPPDLNNSDGQSSSYLP